MLQRNSQTKSNFPQFYLQHQPHLLQSSTNKPSSQSHFQSNLRQKQVTNHFSQRQRIIQIPIQIPLFNGEKSFVYKRPKWIQIQLNKIKQKEGSQMQEVIQWLQLILKRKKNEMERLIEKQMEGQQRQEKYKQFVNDLLKIQNIIRVQLEEKINQEIKIKNKSTTDFDNITDKKITSIDQIQKQQNINEKDSLIIKMINQVQMQIKALLNKKQNILKLIQGNKYEITSKRKGIHRKEYQKINFRSDVKEKLEENQYEQQLLIKQMQKNKGEEKQDKQVRDENQQISSEQYNESEQIEREVEGYMIDQKNQKVDKIEKIYMQKLNQRKKIQQKKIQKPIQVFVDRIIQKPIQVFVDRIVQKEVFVQKPIQVFVDRIIQKPIQVFVDRIIQKPIQVFVDRIIQKPIQVFVDRIVQKEVFVQKPIQVFVDRIIQKEVFVQKPIQVFVDRIIQKPIQVFVDRIIQKPIQVFVDRIIQKPIQVFVDRIIQKEVFVQKPIQVFVDRIIQKEVFVQKPIQVFVDRIIQKPIQVFVDRIVQKEVFVQKPIQVFVDRIIQKEVFVQKPIQVFVDRIIQKPIQVFVDRIIQKEVFVQKPIQVFVDRIIQKPIQVFVDRIVQKEVFVQKPIQVFVDRIIQKEVFVQKPIQVFVDRIIQKPIQVFVDRIIQKPIQVFVDRKKPNQQIFPQFYKISQNVNIIQQIPQNPQQNSLTTQLIISKDKIKQRLQQENHNNNKQSSQNVEKKNLQISSTIQILKLINFDAIKSQSNADINKLTSSINISQFTESNQQQKKQQSNLYPPQQNTKQYQERQKILIQNIREFNDMISKKKHQLQKLQNQISNKSLIQEKQTLIAIQKIHQKELVQKIQILQKQNHQLKQQLEKSKMMIKTELSQNLKLKRQNSNIYKQYQQNKRNTQRTNQKNDQTIKQLIQEINNMKTLQNKNNIQKTETITRYNELIQENQSLKLMIQQYKKQIIQQTLAVIKYKETLLQGDSVINLIVQQKQDIYKKLNELQVNRFDNLSNQQTSLEKQMVIRNTDSYYDSNLSQKPLVKKHKQKLNIENFNKQQIIKLIQQYSEEIQQSQIIIQQLTTKIKQFQTIINYQRKQINKLKQNTLQKRVPQRSSSQKFSKQNYDIKNYDQLQIKATSVYQDLYQIIQKANIDEYIKQQIQSIMKQVQSQKYINQQLQKRVIQCQKKILQKTQSINHLKLTLLKKQSDNIFLNQFKTQQQSMKHTIKNQNNQKRKLSNQSSQIKIYQSQYLYKQDHDYHIRTKQLEQRIRHYELNLIPDLRDQLARYIQKLGIVDDDDDITPRQIYKKQINRTNYQKQSINNQKNQREILEQNIKKFKYQSQQFKNSISKEMHTPPIKGERFEQNKSHSKKLKANPKGLSISSKMKPISLENFIHTESVGKIGIFTIMLRLVEAAQQMINQKKFFTLHPKRIFILNFNEEQFENIQVRIQNLELHETEKDIELFTAPEVLKGQKQNQSSVLWNLGILFDYLINKSLFFKSKYLISSKINYKYENNNLICAKRILQKLLNKSPYSRLNLENLQLNIKFQLKRLLYPK